MSQPAMRNICPACNAVYTPEIMVCSGCGTGLLEVPDMPLLTGATLDNRYDIEGVVGTGGMGAVYRARQRGMEREVAVKVLHPHFAKDPRAVKRFFREAQSASRLVHPNIVTVFDFGRAEDGNLFMVMELLEGWTLGDLIHYRAPLSPSLTIHIASQICGALEAAESARLVHRDLKPDNILLSATDDGFWAKVLDFGIARIARDEDDVQRLRRHESTVEIAGTPAYMAPEQVLGREPAPSSDLYSLGVILYEMLARQRPFPDDTSVALCMRQMNEPVPPLPAHAKVSDALRALVAELLAKRPEDRPASAAEVRRRLEGCPEARIAFTRPALTEDAPRGLAMKTTRGDLAQAMADRTVELKYLSRPHPPLAEVIARSRVAAPPPELPEQASGSRPRRGEPVAILALLAEQPRQLEGGLPARFLQSLEADGAEMLREEKTAIVRVRHDAREAPARAALRALGSAALAFQAEALRQNLALRIGLAPVEGAGLVQAVDEARRLAADTVHGRVAVASRAARAAELDARTQSAIFMPDGSSLEAAVLCQADPGDFDEALIWGRALPLRRLGQIADEATRNGPSRAILIGHRGLGKTGCLNQFLRGRRALRVRVSPLAEAYPGHVIARLAALSVGIPELTGKASDLDPLARAGLQPEERERLEALLLDRVPSSPATPCMWARLVFDLLLRHAAREPLVIALDDAHFIDRASAAILTEVLLLAAGQPWTIVATARNTEPLGFLGDAHRVELKPLGLRPMNQLAEELRLDPRRRHHLLALAQGNPAVLRLLASPDLPQEAPVSLGEGLLPWIFNKVLRRAGPREADRAWVEAATGQGRAFETPLVQAARYFVESGLNPELATWLMGRLAWVGPVGEALAERLGAGTSAGAFARLQRLGLHAVAAEALAREGGRRELGAAERVLLAELHLRAGDAAKARASLERALALSDGGLPLERLVALGQGFCDRGEVAGAGLALQAFAERANAQTSPALAGAYFVTQARLVLPDSGVKAATVSLQQAGRAQEALARSDARGAATLGALIQEARAEIAIAADDVEAARTNYHQARQTLRDLGREVDSLRCLVALGALEAFSEDARDLRRGAETLLVASRLTLAAGLHQEHLRAEIALGEVELALGELDPGTQRLRQAFKAATSEPGEPALQAQAALGMSAAMIRRGLAPDARRYLERALSLAADPLTRARAALCEAQLVALEGHPERSDRALAEAVEQARRAGHGLLAAKAARCREGSTIIAA